MAGDGARRLVYAEADGLPGLLVELLQPRGIYERSDADVREKEGLPAGEGRLWGDEPPERIAIQQQGIRFLVDIRAGQKTGAYLDQAANRLRVAAYCAGREVLDCFCYTGGFTIAAAL